jgi:hypothetical protein
MIRPIYPEKHEGNWIYVEVETGKKKRIIALDPMVALQLNAQMFRIMQSAWEKFHETLIEQQTRANNDHEVAYRRHQDFEGSRLNYLQRQAGYLKISSVQDTRLQSAV